MTSKKNEDFWNSSSCSKFNFDDDEDDEDLYKTVTHSKDVVFESNVDETVSLPIHAIISKEALDLILEDVGEQNYVVLPIEDCIRKMICGQRCDLGAYKSLQDKLKLLDAALETWDGNIIIQVILFLERTLHKNIFHQHMAERKVAIRQYANYLLGENRFQDLADFYMATGNQANIKNIGTLLSGDNTNKVGTYKKLQHFMSSNMLNLNHSEENFPLNDYLKFLQWQIDRNQSSDSVIDQLAILCVEVWHKREKEESLLEFKNKFNINDFQYEWTVLNTLAAHKMWDKLKSVFVKPNWITKKNGLKSVISSEMFVIALSKHEPPKEIIEHFLTYVSDSEKCLNLAERLNCHRYLIEHHIKKRDRLALLAFKARITPQTEEYFLIESALHSHDKKWKN